MTISQLSDYAQLADATYADLPSQHSDDQDIISALMRERGFSQQQAIDFTTRYQTLYSLSNDSVGFAATIYRDKNTGETIFAIRGSEDKKDFYEDAAAIGLSGIALNQAVSLFNFYQIWRGSSAEAKAATPSR